MLEFRGVGALIGQRLDGVHDAVVKRPFLFRPKGADPLTLLDEIRQLSILRAIAP